MEFINGNGCLIHYKWIDHKKETTFLFINSLGTDYRIWDEVVVALNEYGNILLYDKRGHGLSDEVENTSSLTEFTDDVLALLQYLSIGRCIAVGLSVGGMIAQLLAVRQPGIIEKLVLCDTRHKIGSAASWNERIDLLKAKGITAISGGVMERWFSEAFRKNESIKVAGYKNMLERTPVIGYIKTCEAIRDADLTATTRQIKVPVLCVVGSEDKATTPREVKDLADLIEGSGFEVINGSGHIPCVDNPGVLGKLIIDFIKT